MRLLCDSNPMAYGSTSALLAVLDALPPGLATATAWAAGVVGELYEPESLVHHRLPVHPKDTDEVRRRLEDAPQSFDAVLVVSNRSNLECYLDLGLPVFFVDILYWYGGEKRHAVWDGAPACFVEVFPAHPGHPAPVQSGRPPTVVGPLIRQRFLAANPRAGRPEVLVNVGGGRNRWVEPGRNSDYVGQVIDWIAELPLRGKAVLVAAGHDAVRSVSQRPLPEGLEVRSLPQPEFLSSLACCELFMTAPGLNAVFEGLFAGRPMVFLPPQNASQVEQLAVYEQHGLVKPGLNLPDLCPAVPRPGQGVPEDEMTFGVLAGLRRLDEEPALNAKVVEHLSHQLDEVLRPERQAARRRFRGQLGEPGGKLVAQEMLRWWHGSQRARTR